MKNITVLVGMAGLCFSSPSWSQTIVYSDDFTAAQGPSYTTSGSIGSTPWEVSRSGDDWGARIDGGVMTLNNDVSALPNANGWVYSYHPLSSVGDFNTVFSSSAGLMTWTLNMQQIRPLPSGFSTGSYGVAYVIGSSSATAGTSGSGYAVVLGNTGTPDPLRFASFSSGLNSLGTSNSGLIIASPPLANPGSSYMSISLTYNPTDSTWNLFGRDGGTTGFSPPDTGTLALIGSATNSTYTGLSLTSSGAYWQGSTAAAQTAQFDNVRLEVVPEPSTLVLLLFAGIFAVLTGSRAFFKIIE
jgi:hypothetical protein